MADNPRMHAHPPSPVQLAQESPSPRIVIPQEWLTPLKTAVFPALHIGLPISSWAAAHKITYDLVHSARPQRDAERRDACASEIDKTRQMIILVASSAMTPRRWRRSAAAWPFNIFSEEKKGRLEPTNRYATVALRAQQARRRCTCKGLQLVAQISSCHHTDVMGQLASTYLQTEFAG